MGTTKTDYTSDAGAVRADDADFDFCSSPLLAFLGMLKIASIGGKKYGRFNYMKGFPVHVTLNHVILHIIRYCLGDRTEAHLLKAAWGCLVAAQTAILKPEMHDPHMLGAGATLTPEVLAFMDAHKGERDTMRKEGLFEDLCNWDLGDLPEVQNILDQTPAQPPQPTQVPAGFVNKCIKNYIARKHVPAQGTPEAKADEEFNREANAREMAARRAYAEFQAKHIRETCEDEFQQLQTQFDKSLSSDQFLDMMGTVGVEPHLKPPNVEPSSAPFEDGMIRPMTHEELPTHWRPGSANAKFYGFPYAILFPPHNSKQPLHPGHIGLVYKDFPMVNRSPSHRVYWAKSQWLKTQDGRTPGSIVYDAVTGGLIQVAYPVDLHGHPMHEPHDD